MNPEQDLPPSSLSLEPSPWSSLLPELIRHVAIFVSPNEVACSLRPLCRSWASALNGAQYKTVRLSSWAPRDAYAARWGGPGAMRSLTRKRMEDLVRLTSASGSVQNLELAVSRIDCPLTEAVVEAAGAGQLDVLRWLQTRGCPLLPMGLAAAAAGGHLDVCAWFRERGCPFGESADNPNPLQAAAMTGRQDVCAWLLANDCPWTGWAVYIAASAGHVALTDWLLLQRPVGRVEYRHRLEVWRLLRAAAEGCPLPVFQRLHREWAEGPGGWLEQQQQHEVDMRNRVLGAAVASFTPDWEAKVTWLVEERGYPLVGDACCWDVIIRCAAHDEEAVARLKWLQGRTCLFVSPAFHAVTLGRAACARFLLGETMIPGDENTSFCESATMTAASAAAEGRLGGLQAMHEAGVRFQSDRALERGARGGHLPVVRWLLETPGVAAPALTARVATAAAESGDLELLRYLYGRGCPLNVSTYGAALEHGSEEMRMWLVTRGCPTDL